MSRELDLRNLLREVERLEGQAGWLETQTRQLQLNILGKLDARDWVVTATEAKNTADQLVQAADLMERRVKATPRGGYGTSSTVPGLVGTVRDRSKRLAKHLHGLQKELDRIRGEAQKQLQDPLRDAGGASVAFPPTAEVIAATHSMLSAVNKIIQLIRGI
jgi:hypothetical protein